MAALDRSTEHIEPADCRVPAAECLDVRFEAASTGTISNASSTFDMNSPTTVLSVFHFAGHRRAWAFAQMAFARRLMRRQAGLRFYRLLGSGRGIGFSRLPDWGRYGLLSVWESDERAQEFLNTSAMMGHYAAHAERIATVVLRTRTAHGSWGGSNPFLPASTDRPAADAPVAVLTRATIRPSRLAAFWRQVDPVRDALIDAPGLRGSIGIGELPLVRQATFSIWEHPESMQRFAYATDAHREAVRRTRSERWYSEELFARFDVMAHIGRFP